MLGLGICLVATMIGFRLNVPFVVVMVILAGVEVWVLRQSGPGHRHVDHDALQVQVHNNDSHARRVEGWLYGSQPHHALATPELQHAIADLVADRIDAGAPPSDVSADLRRYLAATPAPTVTRSRVRRLIKDVDAL